MKQVSSICKYILSHDVHRFFQAFLDALQGDEVSFEFNDLSYYCEVRWLSRSDVLIRVSSLLAQIRAFLLQRGNLALI